jgi:hypothetical protein
MLGDLSFLALLLIATFVWAAPIAVISIDPRISRKEKAFWIFGAFILSWIAIAMYIFMAPIERRFGDN